MTFNSFVHFVANCVFEVDDALHLLRTMPTHPLRAEITGDIQTLRAWGLEALAAAQNLSDARERQRAQERVRKAYRYVPPAD